MTTTAETAAEPELFPGLKLIGSMKAERDRAVREFQDMQQEHGGMLTQAQAALILGVTRSRVNQLVSEGVLRSFTFRITLQGESMELGKYVSGRAVCEYAEKEKLHGGRPSKLQLRIAGLKIRS